MGYPLTNQVLAAMAIDLAQNHMTPEERKLIAEIYATPSAPKSREVMDLEETSLMINMRLTQALVMEAEGRSQAEIYDKCFADVPNRKPETTKRRPETRSANEWRNCPGCGVQKAFAGELCPTCT